MHSFGIPSTPPLQQGGWWQRMTRWIAKLDPFKGNTPAAILFYLIARDVLAKPFPTFKGDPFLSKYSLASREKGGG